MARIFAQALLIPLLLFPVATFGAGVAQSVQPLPPASLAKKGANLSAAGLEKAISDKIHPDLLKRFNSSQHKDEMVKVVVTLLPAGGSAKVEKVYTTTKGMASLQKRISAMQTAVFEAQEQGNFNLIFQYKSIYGFSGTADEAAIVELAGMKQVAFVEPMVEYELSNFQSHPLTGINLVHQAGFTGDGVTVAILDDGLDHDHEAFGGSPTLPNAKILGGFDFADNDSNFAQDCVGQSHGTGTAGIAVGNDGVSFKGTAPDANLVFLKLQSASQCGTGAIDGDIIGALDWVVTEHLTFNIQVASMSLGFGGFTSVASCQAASPALDAATSAVSAAGVALFGSAGNNGFCNAISAPACMPDVISVGATYDAPQGSPGYCVSPASCVSAYHSQCAPMGMDACFDIGATTDQVTCYSNSADFLDILAPAECAYTAQSGGGNNSCFGGTSAASPFAAGVAASLIEAAESDFTTDTMRTLLIDTGVPVFDSKSNLTNSRINAKAALEAIPRTTCGPADLFGVFFQGGSDLVVVDSFLGGSTPLILGGSAAQAGVNNMTSVSQSMDGNSLFLANDRTDSLYEMDMATGNTALIGPFGKFGSNVEGMDFAPAAASAHGFVPGGLYGINCAGVDNCGPNCLIEIDPLTGEATAISGVPMNQGSAVSFHPLTGELWVYDAGGKNLYTVDGSGQTTLSMTVPSSWFKQRKGLDTGFSLAHSCDGRLFTVDIAYGWLVEIDVENQDAYVLGNYNSIVNPGSTSRNLWGLDGGAP